MAAQVRNFAKTTTIHGLGELLLANSKITKVVWTTLMLASIGVCIWQLCVSIDDFRQGPTITKQSQIPLTEFPKIRFHLYNSISESKMEQLGLNWKHLLVLWDHFPGSITTTPHTNGKQMPYMEDNGLSKDDVLKLQDDLRQVQRANNCTKLVDLIKLLAYSPEKMFSFDRFRDESAKGRLSVEVDVTGISYVFEKTNLSIPLSIQSPDFNLFTVRGRGIAVDIEDLGTKWPFEGADVNGGRGLEIIKGNFHGWWKKSFLTVGDERFDSRNWESLDTVESGAFDIDVRKIRYINSKQRPCSEDYQNQLECEANCWARNDACGQPCKLFTEENPTGIRACLVGLDGGHANASCFNCTEICIPSCERWEYSRKISVFVPATADVRGVSKILVMSVKAMEATFIEEQYSYSTSQLFSNVGGILSLYIGASVLSFAHLLYYWTIKWAVDGEEKARK